MVAYSRFNMTRDRNANISMTPPRSKLKRSTPFDGHGKGGSPDRKRPRGTRSPQREKNVTINIDRPFGPIYQEGSVGLNVDDDEQNKSVLRIGDNTKGVTFVDRPLKITQNKNLSYPYPYHPPDNTLFNSPARTNRSSYNEVDPVQKLNSILKRLEKVLETLLT